METPLDVNGLSNHINIRECTTKLVPINDDNYQTIIDWFKSCLELSSYLRPSRRDEYELNLIGNIKNALSTFFQRTELSLTTLIGLEREITAMFNNLSPPSGIRAKGQSDSSKQSSESLPSAETSCNPTCCEVEEDMCGLYKKLMWVTIASSILLLLLILILTTLCWLRKCIAYDMRESFACCPTREDTQEEANGRKSDTSAFPVRVWLNPFARNLESPSKEQVKKHEKEPKEERDKTPNK